MSPWTAFPYDSADYTYDAAALHDGRHAAQRLGEAARANFGEQRRLGGGGGGGGGGAG